MKVLVTQLCLLLCDPMGCRPQASLSMEFYRQEYWSGFSSVQFSRSVMSDSLQPVGLQHTRFPCPAPLLKFAQTHVHWVSDAIQSSHRLSSPLEWVALPFSRGSSQTRDQTQVSCHSGGFFTSWPTREVLFSTAYKFTASLLSHDYTFCSLEKGTVMTSFQRKPQSWPMYVHYIFKC